MHVQTTQLASHLGLTSKPVEKGSPDIVVSKPDNFSRTAPDLVERISNLRHILETGSRALKLPLDLPESAMKDELPLAATTKPTGGAPAAVAAINSAPAAPSYLPLSGGQGNKDDDPLAFGTPSFLSMLGTSSL